MTRIKQPEKISLLYVCRSSTDTYPALFSNSPDWTVTVENDIRAVSLHTAVPEPDVIFFDSPDDETGPALEMIQWIRRENKFNACAVFLALASEPGPETRVTFLKAGADDIFVKPFLIEEVFLKVQGYLQQFELIQQAGHDRKKLEGLLTDLDAVERQLKSTRDELTDEKDILNSSLKQISKMTREREKLNDTLLDLNNKLISNSAGFTDLLEKMIRAGVEKNKGHSRRVVDMALFVANSMKISETDLVDLKTAATLHEVGRLLFSGKKENTDQDDYPAQLEKDFLLQSPVKGADLLAMCPQYEKPAEIIRYMYENVDGTGTPEGLKKKNIPMLSRILAGADMLDSLYDRMDIRDSGDVLTALEAASGQRLDPVIVSCLEKYVISCRGKTDSGTVGIGISDLKPGMVLAAGLFTATGTKLFSVNTLLDRAAIDKIVKYNREYPVEETVYIKV